jgi:hypothetical protein
VTRADEFRKEADEASRMAAHCSQQENKAVWLRLAEAWNKLAQAIDKTANSMGER